MQHDARSASVWAKKGTTQVKMLTCSRLYQSVASCKSRNEERKASYRLRRVRRDSPSSAACRKMRSVSWLATEAKMELRDSNKAPIRAVFRHPRRPTTTFITNKPVDMRRVCHNDHDGWPYWMKLYVTGVKLFLFCFFLFHISSFYVTESAVLQVLIAIVMTIDHLWRPVS